MQFSLIPIFGGLVQYIFINIAIQNKIFIIYTICQQIGYNCLSNMILSINFIYLEPLFHKNEQILKFQNIFVIVITYFIFLINYSHKPKLYRSLPLFFGNHNYVAQRRLPYSFRLYVYGTQFCFGLSLSYIIPIEDYFFSTIQIRYFFH